jgi:MerR family Zn(II)-responsive transcriptional regulator of zntA
MLIKELSERAGLSAHTIRFYERCGLISGQADPNVRSNNYKQYDIEVIGKLELIKEAKAIGFTLSEIKDLVDSWYSNRLSPEEKLAILQEKVVEVDAKLAQLQGVRLLLEKGIESVRADLCRPKTGQA